MERSSENSGKFHSGEIIIISGEIIIQPSSGVPALITIFPTEEFNFPGCNDKLAGLNCQITRAEPVEDLCQVGKQFS